MRRERWLRSFALALALVVLRPSRVTGSPLEYLPVGDPLEAELRTLDVLGPALAGQRLRLPHSGTRPVQRFELDSLPRPDPTIGLAHRISLVRLWRVLAREGAAVPGDPVAGLTPRLYQKLYPEGARFEMSLGAEGIVGIEERRARYRSDTGAHFRVALETDRWLAFSHLIVGYEDSARAFADPIIRGTDIIVHTAESYFAYTGSSRHWGVQFGRSRWHWGPGEEGSLMLSKTSVPITGVAFHARLEPLHADGTAISATLASSAGEQLAAHRLEWQPFDGLRLGLAEGARYRASSWSPLYVLGVIPYILVQRLQDQDEPGAVAAHRNNIVIGADVAWRVAPGTRLYAEWLADDLALGNANAGPSRYAYQLGWEGAGVVRSTRLVWGGEYTRVTPFTYTSSYGRAFLAQGRPLGFPFAPDARRMRVHGAWDLSPAWQLTAVVTRADKGEYTLADPYISGAPPIDTGRLQGVVEGAREVEAGVRWWPAGGVDLAASTAYHWIDNLGHIPGSRSRGLTGTIAFSLVR